MIYGDSVVGSVIAGTETVQLLNRLIAKSLDRYGGVAQLGERLLCTQEVIGSNPFTSTIFSLAAFVELIMNNYDFDRVYGLFYAL